MGPGDLPAAILQLGDGIHDEVDPFVGRHVRAGDELEGLSPMPLVARGGRHAQTAHLNGVGLGEAAAQEAGRVLRDRVDPVHGPHDEAARGDVAARRVGLVDVVGVRPGDDLDRPPPQLATSQHPAQSRPGEEPVGVDGQVTGPLQAEVRQEPAHPAVGAQGDRREAHIHPEAPEALPRRRLHQPLPSQQDLRGAQDRVKAPVGQPGGRQQGAAGVGRQRAGLTGPLAQANRDDDDLVVGGAQCLDLLLEELLPHLVGVEVGEQEQAASARPLRGRAQVVARARCVRHGPVVLPSSPGSGSCPRACRRRTAWRRGRPGRCWPPAARPSWRPGRSRSPAGPAGTSTARPGAAPCRRR